MGLSKTKKIVLGVVFVVVLGLIIGLIVMPKDKKEENKDKENNIVENEEPKVEKKLQIIDEDSNSRTIAVQINNHNQARLNHAGLNDAYVVYEAVVEGGITRMLALFKDKDTTKIGSVRSARPYFLDYILENDAIYVHFGFSDKARDEIASLGINNINGLYDNAFWRDRNLGVDYEHTAYTNMENIRNMIASKGYRTTTEQKTLLNYNVDEVTIKEEEIKILEDGTSSTVVLNNASKVTIPYSYYMTVRYEYDSASKMYKRFTNNVAHTDSITKEQYAFKNIIVIFVKNYTTTEGSGRQALENIGNGSGFYITNGNYKKIVWQKDSRSSQTVYKYENGEEISVNDGNTFIQIVPIENTVTFE